MPSAGIFEPTAVIPHLQAVEGQARRPNRPLPGRTSGSWPLYEIINDLEMQDDTPRRLASPTRPDSETDD